MLNHTCYELALFIAVLKDYEILLIKRNACFYILRNLIAISFHDLLLSSSLN